MTVLDSVLRNTGFSIASDLSTRVANTLLFILISRSLGVSSAGTFSLGLSYFFIGSRLSYCGLDNLLTRDVARQRNEAGRYLVNFIALRVATAVIVILAIALILRFLPYSQQTRLVVLLTCFSILPESISELCQALFIAFERVQYLTLVSVLDGVSKLALGVLCLKVRPSVEVVALVVTGVNVLSMGIYLFLATIRLTKLCWRIDWPFCIRQLRIAVPFVFIGLFFILDNRVDIILLSVLSDERSVGLYSAAVTIVTALAMIPQGFRTAIYPVLARYQATDAKATLQLYAHSFKYLLLLALPMTLGAFLVADDIIRLVYRSDFAPSGAILRIAVWSLLAYSLNILNSRFLIVSERQDLVARFLLISLVSTIVLNVLLVPFSGAVGAAIVKSITAILLFSLNEQSASRLLEGFSPWRFLLRPLVAGLLMTIVALSLKPYGLFVVIPAAAGAYFTVLLFLGTFSRQERDLWRRTLLRWKVGRRVSS